MWTNSIKSMINVIWSAWEFVLWCGFWIEVELNADATQLNFVCGSCSEQNQFNDFIFRCDLKKKKTRSSSLFSFLEHVWLETYWSNFSIHSIEFCCRLFKKETWALFQPGISRFCEVSILDMRKLSLRTRMTIRPLVWVAINNCLRSLIPCINFAFRCA